MSIITYNFMDWKLIKKVHLFTPGTRVDALGSTVSIGLPELKALADSYNPSVHEAPVILGHSSDDFKGFLSRDTDPANGWVVRLYVEDGSLYCDMEVSPDLAGAMRNQFRKRSIGLYRPNTAISPTPNSYYLRHVALLGATPPAVKGLKNVFMEFNIPDLDMADILRDLIMSTKDKGQNVIQNDRLF